MPRQSKKLRPGIGAKCSVLLKFLHPVKYINAEFPNIEHNQRLDNLLLMSEKEIRVNRIDQKCYVFRHDDFENIQLHATKRWVKIEVEGPENSIFQPDSSTSSSSVEVPSNSGSDSDTILDRNNSLLSDQLHENLQHVGNNSEDIAMIRGMGFLVDDDNEPVEENIPEPNSNTTAGLKEGQSFGWNGFDERKKEGLYETNAKMINLRGIPLESCSFMTMFNIFFSTKLGWMIIIESNKRLEEPLDVGEWLCFLGIILFMSTFPVSNRRDYWSSKPVNIEYGAPFRFNKWMTLNRFETILYNLVFTNEDKPAYKDKFWQVRRMIQHWNDNMKMQYSASWVSCLDESMSIWLSKFTCPGWVFCPRKPHPFGNEYHSICDGITNIMYGIEIVEGKDAPAEREKSEYSEKGPTVGLLLRLCKSLYNTGKVVILDSGFCVLKGLIELRKVGVFASAVIKKRRYWPKDVPGDVMNERVNDRGLGYADSVKGTQDNIPYNLFMMKDKNFIMKLMSTYGGLTMKPDQKKTYRWYKGETPQSDASVKTFKYPEPFANHYLYRHCVDDHNNLRHSVPSIEGTMVTHRWEFRVFSFLLAISEVNTYLAMKHFVWKDKEFHTLHQFRRKLALSLIHNEHIVQYKDGSNSANKRRRRDKTSATDHSLLSAPPHAKKFLTKKWDLSSKSAYQQFTCKMDKCTNKTRYYCACHIGHWMCKYCHPVHVSLASTNNIEID